MKEARVTVRSKVGLHARPAAMFVQEALKFKCKVTIESGDKTADGKSILRVLALGVKCGQEIVIRTDGEGEDEALASLVSLIENTPESL